MAGASKDRLWASPWLIASVLLIVGASPPLRFVPVQPGFAAASADYERIWKSEGSRIAAALEAISGLRFPDTPIQAIVSNARPMTSYDGRLIRLRASYSPDYRRATLIHELGHRLALTLPRPAELDDHRLLYLFLYDTWTDLEGKDFAERMVAIERRIPGGYDYDAAWSWALSQTREQRQERLRALRASARTDGRVDAAGGAGGS